MTRRAVAEKRLVAKMPRRYALFPERLEGWIGEDNGVRVIDSVGQPMNFQ